MTTTKSPFTDVNSLLRVENSAPLRATVLLQQSRGELMPEWTVWINNSDRVRKYWLHCEGRVHSTIWHIGSGIGEKVKKGDSKFWDWIEQGRSLHFLTWQYQQVEWTWAWLGAFRFRNVEWEMPIRLAQWASCCQPMESGMMGRIIDMDIPGNSRVFTNLNSCTWQCPLRTK